MKYVILTGRNGTIVRKVPVIFPNFMVHADVAQDMRRRLLKMGMVDVEPWSAGEYNPMTGDCTGSSSTLGLSAGPNDDVAIQTYDYTHGI